MSVDDHPDDREGEADIYRVYPEGLVDEVRSGEGHEWTETPGRGKVPKQAGRNANAKSNDPSTWVPAEEALQSAVETPGRGFGFPCTQEHDLMFLDIDMPWGGEWVPEFDTLGGAVFESSPSKNLRGVLKGVEMPDWWTNLGIDGEDKPELKLFRDTGYVSLTGDVLEGYEPPLEETTQVGFERFLKLAWVGFKNEIDPDVEHEVTEADGPWNTSDDSDLDEWDGAGAGGNSGDDHVGDEMDGEEWLTEADIRDALRHLDPTLTHDSWVRVGFAIGEFFGRDDTDGDEETALELFEEWSRGDLHDEHSGAKWDTAAKKRAPDIVSRAAEETDEWEERTGRDPTTIGTLIEMARDAGWDISACPSAELGRVKRFRGDSADADADADAMGMTYDESIPVYEVLEPEDGDVELRIVPIDGTTAGIEVAQSGRVEYHEVLDRGFWNSRTTRGRIAGEVANTLTGVDQNALKQGIKDALTEVGVEERDQPEAFEDKMRSDRETTLRERTEQVVCHPTADITEWVITMAPPDDSPVTNSQRITLTQGDFIDANASAFKSKHLATFFSKVELDHKEWDGLTDYWLEQQVTDDYEPNHRVEALAEKFTDWVSNLRVWADAEGFSWSSLHGYYVEDFAGTDEDAVLVPGQQVMDWYASEHGDEELNFSKELRERDIMLTTTKQKSIGGTRRSVWPISAEATGHSLDTAHHVSGDEDNEDDRPQGLR